MVATIVVTYLIGVFTGAASILIAVRQFQEGPPTSGH
jgi:hypothetical protein